MHNRLRWQKLNKQIKKNLFLFSILIYLILFRCFFVTFFCSTALSALTFLYVLRKGMVFVIVYSGLIVLTFQLLPQCISSASSDRLHIARDNQRLSRRPLCETRRRSRQKAPIVLLLSLPYTWRFLRHILLSLTFLFVFSILFLSAVNWAYMHAEVFATPVRRGTGNKKGKIFVNIFHCSYLKKKVSCCRKKQQEKPNRKMK